MTMRLLIPLAVFGLVLTCPQSILSQQGKNIRIHFEWVELELADLHTLVSDEAVPLSGEAMREEIDQLIEDDRASVVRATMVQGRSGQRIKSGAFTAMSFPERFTVPQVSRDGRLKAEPVVDSTAMRNLGVTVEVDPLLDSSTGRVSIHVAPEFVSLLRQRSWGKGVAEVELPEFYSMKGVTRLHLENGKSRLVSTFRPHQSLRPEGSETAEPRWLLFATAHFETSKENSRVPGPDDSDFAIHYEFYETDMTTLNSWIVDEALFADGPDLQNRFEKAISEGDATLLDSVVAAGAPGEVRFQSARQVLYPTYYDAPEVDRPVPAMPEAFQEWEVGLLIQFQSEWQPNGSLRIAPQDRSDRGRPTAQHVVRWDREIGEQRWLERESEVAFPLFYSMKIQQPVFLHQNEVVLLGTLRPHREEGETEQSIITVFARMEKFVEE